MPAPKLILVGGSPATGKTTVSRKLGEATGIARVSLDEIKEALFDRVGYRNRAWSKQVGQIAFPAFQRLVEIHLERGDSVIADATFLWLDDARWIRELAARTGVELVLVWLTADPRVLRERFLTRANTSRHPGHCDSLDEVLAEFDERFFTKTFLPLPLGCPTCVVDTTDLGAVQHEEILSFVCAS